MKQVVNDALRSGLRDLTREPGLIPYKTDAHAMGLQAGISLDNIQELLAQVEGEQVR